MHHIDLKECSSTQLELKNYLKSLDKEGSNKKDQILLSTKKQNSGKGRRQNTWQHFHNSLAFSFTLKVNEIKTLTSLEMAIHIKTFFEKLNIDLALKWPNDLYYRDKKCGGILLDLFEQDLCIVGVGINLHSEVPDSKKLDFDFSLVDLNPSLMEISQIPMSLVEHINQNRLSASEVYQQFNESCMHLNRQVEICDDKTKVVGKYLKIGKNGQAIIELPGGELQSVYTGSLNLV
ncbi:biotin--[acetyl-CoA-carboxylase] ligase [bacterium]|nr:biotin--[acetyl-CoA-carboxylase] ligase [bacterium]